MTRRRKADDPELRAHVERLRRAGMPVDRQAIAKLFGVGTGTVQTVRSEIDQAIAAETATGDQTASNQDEYAAPSDETATAALAAATRDQPADAHEPAASSAETARTLQNGKPKRAEGGRTVQDFDGRQLVHWRRQRLLMQDELASKAGISRGEIGHLERRRRKPTLRTLRKLSEALQVDASELLEEADHEAS